MREEVILSLQKGRRRLKKFAVEGIEPSPELADRIVRDIVRKVRFERRETAVCREIFQRATIEKFEQFPLMIAQEKHEASVLALSGTNQSVEYFATVRSPIDIIAQQYQWLLWLEANCNKARSGGSCPCTSPATIALE